MSTNRTLLAGTVAFIVLLVARTAPGQDSKPVPASEPAKNGCLECHADPERFDGADRKFLIQKDAFADDVHFARGLALRGLPRWQRQC